MSVRPPVVTSEDFWEFVHRPENQNRFFERVRGEIVEVSPSNTYSSQVAGLFLTFINLYLFENPIGSVSGEGGGYDLPNDTTYAPDVAFVSKARQERFPTTGFNPVVPDLVVEVISPANTANEIHRKVLDYLAAGVRLVIVVYPIPRTVVVHTSEGSRTLTVDDTLDGGDVLPGFTLPVRKLFPD